MAQAKTQTQAEFDQGLRYISQKQRYSIRNRTMLYTSFYSGTRVGEIAALKLCDVCNEDGSIKHEIRLSAAQTKATSDVLRLSTKSYGLSLHST